MGFFDAFRATTAAPPPPTGPPLSFPFGAPMQEYGSPIEALVGTLDSAPKLTPAAAQTRLAAMIRGYDNKGGLISHGGVVTFVESVIGIMFGRMELRSRINEDGTWRWTDTGDAEHAAINAWTKSFNSGNQNHQGLLRRFIMYWRVFGELWVVRYNTPNGGLRYDVIPPYMATIKDGRFQWNNGGQKMSIPLNQAEHIINDWLEPGIPHSQWFSVLDNLERIDTAFQAIDRATASSLLMTKIVSIRRVEDESTTVRPRAAAAATHQTDADGNPIKQEGVRYPGEQAGKPKPHKLATDLDTLAGQRTDNRYRRKQKLASAQFYQGPYTLDVVDPLVEIDEALFKVIETDTQIVARASTLPTNFILSGFGEDSGWTAYATKDEVLDNTLLPTINEAIDVFVTRVMRPEIERLRLVAFPDIVEIAVDPSVLQKVSKSCQEALAMREAGEINQDGLRRLTGLEEDMMLDHDDEDQVDQWLATSGRRRATTDMRATERSEPTPQGPVTAAAPQYDWTRPMPPVDIQASLDDQLNELLSGLT